ncbi:MAG TPA: hypothetical protein VFA50_08250 [Stellaceae bacterium]|nr:hypothetical protein [Stellaceae bacterium]
MLGLGFSKLVLLVVVILLVWYGYKYVARVEEVRQALRRARDAAEGRKRAGAARLEAEDMVKCRSCGTYVAARGASRCGRSDCPW